MDGLDGGWTGWMDELLVVENFIGGPFSCIKAWGYLGERWEKRWEKDGISLGQSKENQHT